MKPAKKDVQPLEVIKSLQEYLFKYGEQNTACLLMYEAMCCIKAMVGAGKPTEPVSGPRERDLIQALSNLDPLVRALMNRLGSGEACGGLDGDQSKPNSTTQVLLRAINKFEERVRNGAEPVNLKTGEKGDIVGWLRRRSDWPMVSMPGKLAGEIADHIESLSEKDADHLRDATKMIEPVKVPSENDLWPKGETRYFCDRCSMTLGAEVVLEIAKDFNPAQAIDHARRVEGDGE